MHRWKRLMNLQSSPTPAGMRPFKAKCMQLLTAIGALTGCGLALFAGQGAGLEAANLYILPFTAGGMGPQSAPPYHNYYFGALLYF